MICKRIIVLSKVAFLKFIYMALKTSPKDEDKIVQGSPLHVSIIDAKSPVLPPMY